MAEMERKINFLMKAVEERDHEITALREQMRTRETAESSQTPVVKVQQLQDMIANSIRAQYGGPPQTTFMYSKSYTKRINNLRMLLGYQPSKFQQFDGNATQSNISPTSSKHVRMQDQEETNLSGNSFEA
ncbi:ty3-gypsy retrotransposon protein [Cucumis melo var. makuwa]|uniref:Ty3-gypsy retrotransposon protein n=1 Tax=Cucumis melo var. makuwa TaxID=1194695 RepID=A0A5D3E2R1_CUCMM|nr:ty3-gypsy retrotransposon protein [Cucumis melo var. makuwa]TYK30367.1 ty3-gypsy retrotransposon protein [Cucumis melo var. makuwa]